MKSPKLSHVDGMGRARMVDVSGKAEAFREAVAEASLAMKEQTYRSIAQGKIPKGDVFAAARIAAIQAAKMTPGLIPLCHPLPIGAVEVAFSCRFAGRGRATVRIRTTVRAEAKTGLEMEALVAASTAALTVYDMCKAVDRWMSVREVRLISKKGGKAGTVTRPGLKAADRELP